MDFSRITWDYTWVCVILPLFVWLIWWFNDIWYVGLKLKSQRRIINGTKLPPGHMGLPFFGEMLLFLWYFKIVRRPDDYIHSKRHKYGDGIGLYRTHLFGSPTIIACSPMVNKFVLQSSDSNFILEWPTEELLGTTSLFATHGEGHTRLRTYVERTINQPKALRRIALLLQPRLIAALKSWSEKKTVVAFKESKKVTFENIGRLFASFEPGPILDKLEIMFTGLTHGFRSSPINFPGTAFHHALQCRKNIIKIFGEELKNRKKSDVDDGNHRDDVMDGLMRLKDTDGKQLSDIEILDNIASLVIGGYMSTSLAMMWTLYYLAISPNVLQKLRDENMPLSKSKNGELITSDEVAKLTYTNQVVEEILRLGNLAWLLFRRVTKDVEYKGYTIPKGWKVLLWSRYIHTNPENFEDPLCFNPDRWNAANKPMADQIFGGGPRICAGNMLARLQLALVIHHLATGYKWELVNPNAKVVYLPHPKPVDGVEMAFTKL